MKNKILWLLVSGLMVVSLILASCAPAAPVEEKPAPTSPTPEKPAPTVEEKPAAPVAEKEMVKDSLGRLVEKPKYGGVLVELWDTEPAGFDPAFSTVWTCSTTALTNECLVGGDWAKSAAGTGDCSFFYNYTPLVQNERGLLAESWELKDPQTIIYHIRKGVRWHNKPPMNGRELTADDVVFGFMYLKTSKAGSFPAYLKQIESITATDKWTVVMKCEPGKTAREHTLGGHYAVIMPREVIEQNQDMRRWEVSCGTGAFMLVDYITNSAATFERNPNYWMNQPLYPEDRVPYVDTVKRLFITDRSTQMAALRTAKVDISLLAVTFNYEDAQSLKNTAPNLKWRILGHECPPGCFAGKITSPPFNDIRVRQALMLAIDHEGIVRDFYKGSADILAFPIPNVPDMKDAYIPVEELPQNLRELYEYHPDKAKQLLAEAGYPDGFKTEVVTMQPWVDMLTLVQAYWAKVGVELQIDVKERAIWVSQVGGRTFKGMATTYIQPGDPRDQLALTKGEFYNVAMVDDPRLNEALDRIAKAWPDTREQNRMLKEITPYIIEQCYYVTVPAPYQYTCWQPWVRDYNGERYSGYMGCIGQFSKYLWLDLDLKEKMTGRR